MILKRLIVLLVLIITASACNELKGPEKPKNLISKRKMVDILLDARIMNSATSKNKIMMQDVGIDIDSYVYEKHNIDSLQFVLSNDYYTYHVEEYEAIYEQLADSLESLKTYLKAKEAEEWKAQTKKAEDSLEQRVKGKALLPVLSKDSLGLLKKHTQTKIKDALLDKSLEKSKEDIQDLIAPISN